LRAILQNRQSSAVLTPAAFSGNTAITGGTVAHVR